MQVVSILILLAGVANFAMHRWMLESGHPLVEAATQPVRNLLGAHATYVIEFAVLIAALWLSDRYGMTALIGYGVYTALNAGTIGFIKGNP